MYIEFPCLGIETAAETVFPWLSVGMDISPIDLINIERFSNRVVSLASYRLELQEYLRSEMSQVAPNLAALIGDVVRSN